MRIPANKSLQTQARRGVVLLVVLALLTLFAAVGIAFVVFSEQEGTAAVNGLQKEEYRRPDPELLWAYALNQLLFEPSNTASALRSHSLLVNMYGPGGRTAYNGAGRLHTADPLLGIDAYYLPNFQNRLFTENNINPVTGLAIYPPPFTGYGSLNPPYTYLDNNSYYLGGMNSLGVVLARSFVREGPPVNDPLNYPNGLFNPWDGSTPARLANYKQFWGSPTGPYNLNIDQKRAIVLRPIPADIWNPGPPDPRYNASLPVNPNGLISPVLAGFPMPADAGGDVKNLPPGTVVRLADGSLFSGNDSYWTDLGFPNQMGADGKAYRPMFAFYIMDLDGRVNVNNDGNIRGVDINTNTTNLSVSNRGMGQSEINLNKVLVNALTPGSPITTPTGEMPALFLGTPGIQAPFRWYGRFGVGLVDKPYPPATAFAGPNSPLGLGPVPGRLAPYYSRIDSDGTRDWANAAGANYQYNPSLPIILPGAMGPYPIGTPSLGSLGYDRFARFWQGDVPAIPNPVDPNAPSPLGYPRNYNDYLLSLLSEYTDHPFYFDALAAGSGNRNFPAYNMEAVLRHGDTGTDSLVSEIRRLLPNAISNSAVRRLITTNSTDLDRPGVIPYNDGATHRLALGGSYPLTLTGGPIPFPGAVPPNSEFTNNWRSALAALGRVDLNRALPDYPSINPNTGTITDTQAFQIATWARQKFAADIYLALVTTAGGLDPFNTPAGFNPKNSPDKERVQALRVLAQLAVNIVDYIDNDNYITPFNWGGKVSGAAVGMADINLGSAAFMAANSPDGAGAMNAEWVYGTELQRLLLNEVYAEQAVFDNGNGKGNPNGDHNLNFWAELYNPMREDSSLPLEYDEATQQPIQATDLNAIRGATPPRGGVARLQYGGANPYAAYQLVLTQDNQHLRDPNNVLGDRDGNGLEANNGPDTVLQQTKAGNGQSIVGLGSKDWSTNGNGNAAASPPWVYAADNFFEGVNGSNLGYYLLGPSDSNGNNGNGNGNNGGPMQVPGYANNQGPVNTLSRPEMQANDPTPNVPQYNVTAMLRRLLCPHMPLDNNMFLPSPPNAPNTPNPNYNPYITVDYIEHIDAHANQTDYRQKPFKGKGKALGRGKNGGQGSNNLRASVGKYKPYMSYGAGTNTQQPLNDVNAAGNNPGPDGPVENTFFMINQDVTTTASTLPPEPGNSRTAYTASVNPPSPPYPNGYYPTDFKTGLGTPGGYDWLVHLDREVTSPMELLHVSWYKPHELTQQFVALPDPTKAMGNNNPLTTFAHTMFAEAINGNNKFVSPWFDQNLRLYRAFEFFEARSRMAGEGNITLRGVNFMPANLPNPPNGFLMTVTLQSSANLPPNDPRNLFNDDLSIALNRPAGITAGDGAVWSIGPGSMLIVDNGTGVDANGQPLEERVFVTAVSVQVNAGSPRTVSYSFTGYFTKNHNAGALGLPIAVPILGGRQPGKININTVWPDGQYQVVINGQPLTLDYSLVFRALCDAQQCNSFYSGASAPNTDQNVDLAFSNLIANFRTANGAMAGYSTGYTAAGGTQWPGGIGINNTPLASIVPNNPSPDQPRLFEVAGQSHPYFKYELMTKLFNNLTVRSNCFAIWCTVGYFQVDTNGKLGPEILRADGKQLRHRFFAIADRSTLDPWIQMMNGILSRYFNNDWVAQYDVATGVTYTLLPGGNAGNPKPNVPSALILPLLGNANFDPRKEYAAIPVSVMLPNGTVVNLPSGPPATILHWSVIE